MTEMDLMELENEARRWGRLIFERNRILDSLLYWWPPCMKRVREIDRELNNVDRNVKFFRECIMKRVQE